MKRILSALFILVLSAGVAVAGWNISQNDDGGTAWVNGDGVRVGVGGGTVIKIPIANITSGATQYYTVARPGTIVRAYLTATTTLFGSTTPVVSLYVIDGVSSDAVITTQVTSDSVISGQTTGVLSLVTGVVGTTFFNTFNTNNTAARGNLIAIVPTTVATGGTGSDVAANGPDVYVTIVIE